MRPRPSPTLPRPARPRACARAAARALALLAAAALPAGTAPARADVPFPTCADAGCADPADFGSYLFLPPGELPDDFDPTARSSWKYNPVTGMDVSGAWESTTGRPDVVVAVLDSGIRWSERDVVRKVALNTGELPPGPGCAVHDCNGDGFVSVDDYAGVPDLNANGFLDGQDLIRFYSDGVDDDGNGYVDDIAGWDFAEGDNDPDDDVDYGHGTGQAEDAVGEANNGAGMPGVAPSALFLPLRVGDSFIAVGSDFAQAVVYATDRGVDVIQEALGTVSASASSQAAIDYAYRRGIPLIASAADEESRHHNLPARLDHTIWVNSIVHGDGTLVEQTEVYDLLNGCTNYGGRAWVSISSNACSSEATGRAGGLAALLVSHGKNLMDAGLLAPYPGLTTPFSAEEVRQLFRRSASDVDHAGALDDLSMQSLLVTLLSAPPLNLFFGSRRFPTQPGWDQYTGYGRPDAVQLLDVRPEAIPPEADLTGELAWFDVVDPVRTRRVKVRGSAAALRAGGSFDWTLEVGCGVQPTSWQAIGGGSANAPLRDAKLATWRPGQTATSCGFDPAQPVEDPDGHTVTLRLRVLDRLGNLGEDRRTLAIHHDPALRFAPRDLGASAEGSAALADVDRDGVLDVIFGTADGHVHAVKGATGEAIPGFPARTRPLPVHPSPSYASGEVPVPHESIVSPAAADDVDGDGRVEIAVTSLEGGLYLFDDHGRLLPGFPVTTDPALSDPANRDPLNDTDPGISAAPTLVDLDPPGAHPALELVVAAFDGHVYAWRHDASPVPGFPVRIADRAKVALDPATGRATPLVPGVRERGAKIVGSPAVGDLDGDGRPEILVASNEEYAGEPGLFAVESFLLALAQQFAEDLGGDFSFDTGGRLYALRPDGDAAAGGPFLPGWPVRVPLIAPGLLPTVGTGVPGAAALADLEGTGTLAAAIFGVAGPTLLFRPDGSPFLGTIRGAPRGLAADFPDGFPEVPSTAGSGDAPFFPALGSGAFGDLTGDGLPEYAAPTAGLRKLLDVAAAAEQAFGDHQVSAWNPRDGQLLPAFPRLMDDTQFLSSPALVDVDGDGVAEVLAGSGAYLLRAYRADGTTPAGFPKFTHGWLLASPAPGDVDGDGLVEVVATTREGKLFVWDTPGLASEASIPWQGFGRDRRNTQNLSSGVSPLAAPVGPFAALVWSLESIQLDLDDRLAGASLAERRKLRLARAALAMALAAFEDDDAAFGALLLPFVDLGLAKPAVQPLVGDLRERLQDAVADAAERSAAEVVCAPGDADCALARDRAAEAGELATFFDFFGLDGVALGFRARAIAWLAPYLE